MTKYLLFLLISMSVLAHAITTRPTILNCTFDREIKNPVGSVDYEEVPYQSLQKKPLVGKITFSELSSKHPKAKDNMSFFHGKEISLDVVHEEKDMLWLKSADQNLRLVQIIFDGKNADLYLYLLWGREFMRPKASDYFYVGHCE